LGEFAADSSTAIADVNGDGFGDLIVWTNAAAKRPVVIEVEGEGVPVGVYVFFGGEARFAAQLSREDADVRLTLQPGEFVARVAGQDLDGDGKAELVVHAATESSDAFPSSSAEIIRDGVVSSWFVVLPSRLGRARARVHRRGHPGVRLRKRVRGACSLCVPGSRRGGRRGVSHGAVSPDARRCLQHQRARPGDGGDTSASHRAGSEYLDVRGVLDHDGDGISDVAVTYVRLREELSDANPTERANWREVGIGIFYGPLTGDITLGDEGTQRFSIPLLFLTRHAVVRRRGRRAHIGGRCLR
jgi:hypothetical protein